MQTTLTIDDDLLQLAKEMAAARGVTVDTVVSELVRKGIERTVLLETCNGLPVFRVPPGTRPVTTDDVRRGEDEP